MMKTVPRMLLLATALLAFPAVRGAQATSVNLVSFGSETYTSPTVNNLSGGFSGWTLRSTTFTASSASQLLMFVFTGSPSGSFPVGALDGVWLGEPSPAPVPEIDPASFSSALALVVGALGILERRARKQLVAAVA